MGDDVEGEAPPPPSPAEFEVAAALFKKGLKLKPELGESIVAYGMVLLLLGGFDQGNPRRGLPSPVDEARGLLTSPSRELRSSSEKKR